MPLDSQIVRLHERIHSFDKVLEHSLCDIRRTESILHAWEHVDEGVSQNKAHDITRRVSSLDPGAKLPLLCGVPLGVKDIINVLGWPTSHGFAPFRGKIANSTASMVDRCLEAGAVVLGKTVTTPFACFDPAGTRNPWNLAHTPGGSSSGSAAAVASGQCPIALATQTGGSILRPAAYCGVVGLKTEHGRWPLDGVFEVAPSLDHVGVIAASVADAAIATAAFDQRKDISSREIVARLGEQSRQSFRFCKASWNDLGDVDPEMTSQIDQFATILGQRYEIQPEPLGDWRTSAVATHRVIMCYELARNSILRSEVAFAELPEGVRKLLVEGAEISDGSYLEAKRQQAEMRGQWIERLGDRILLMPAAPGPAPARSENTTGDPRMNSPWSLVGLPTMTIPIGLSTKGLPLGLQLVAADVANLLAAAYACESMTTPLGPPPFAYS